MTRLLWNGLLSALVIGLGGVLCLDWLRACGIHAGRKQEERSSHCEGLLTGGWEGAAIFGIAALFRLAVALFAALLLSRQGIFGLDGNLTAWMRWDAWHYVHLVDLGYAGYLENGQPLFLVFFPLYVWIVRLLNHLIGNTMLCGMLISSLCYAGGCVFLYRLTALEYGRAAARRTILFLSLFPYAFFFGGTMTEGLFLLTTAACLYYTRTHRWWIAGLWGALAAMSRMQGLLMSGVIFVEMMESAHPFDQKGLERHREWTKLIRIVPAAWMPLLGTLSYLYLNFHVTGDPFSFVQQQKHWSQGFCWISETLRYLLYYAKNDARIDIRQEIWIPSLILFFLFFSLLCSARRRYRNMYLLYAFTYLILTYSLSWLLSAGRYLSCALPFFFFAAVQTERRPAAVGILSVGMGILLVRNLVIYLSGGQIM